MESMLVMGFITSGIVVGVLAWQKVAESSRIDSANQTVAMIVKSANNFSVASLDYGLLADNPKFILPANMFDASGAMRNSPWGAVSLTTVSVARPKDSYQLTMDSVPTQGCARMAMKNMDSFSMINVNGVKAWKFGEPEPSPADLVAACSKTLNKVVLTSTPIGAGNVMAVAPSAPAHVGPAPAAGPSPSGAPAPAPGPGPGPSAAPAPGPGPSAAPAPGPGPSAAPAPGPGPSAAPAPAPAADVAPAPAPAADVAPAPAPAADVAPAPAPAADVAPATAPAADVAPAPAPAADVAPAPAPAADVAPAPAPDVFAAPAPAPDVFAAPAPAPDVFAAPAPAPDVFAAPAPAPDVFAAPAPAPDFFAAPIAWVGAIMDSFFVPAVPVDPVQAAVVALDTAFNDVCYGEVCLSGVNYNMNTEQGGFDGPSGD